MNFQIAQRNFRQTETMNELRALNARFIHNFVTNDVASHDAILHPDFINIWPTGQRWDVRPRSVAFNFIAEGDYVVVEARGDNVTKAGLRYDNHYCMVWRIENGKIKQIKEYCDSALVERVLGPFPEAGKLAAG